MKSGMEQNISNNPVSQSVLREVHGASIKEPDWDQMLDDDLDKEIARSNWNVIVAEIKEQGRLDIVTMHQIKRLVLAYVLYEVASRHVFAEGAVKKARRSKMPSYNPWFSIMKDATTMANIAERELMVTPKRKSTNGQQPKTAKARAPRAADAYLNRPHRLKSANN